MASARLEKAYTGANGNMKKWTISVWIKRAGLDSTQYIFGAGENNSADGKIAFNSSNQLYLDLNNQEINIIILTVKWLIFIIVMVMLMTLLHLESQTVMVFGNLN